MEVFTSTFACHSDLIASYNLNAFVCCHGVCVWGGGVCVVHRCAFTGIRADNMLSYITIYLIAWKKRLLLNWKLSNLTRLVGQRSLRIRLCLSSQWWDYSNMQPYLSFNMGPGVWSSSPQEAEQLEHLLSRPICICFNDILQFFLDILFRTSNIWVM